jgi:hypothetical protein
MVIGEPASDGVRMEKLILTSVILRCQNFDDRESFRWVEKLPNRLYEMLFQERQISNARGTKRLVYAVECDRGG